MIVLIKNEIIKLLARRKTLVVIIAFALFAGLMAFGIYQGERQRSKWDTVEFKIQNMKEQVEYMKRDKENAPEAIKNDEKKLAAHKQRVDEQVASMEKEIVNLEASKGKDIDWRAELKSNITSMEAQIKSQDDMQGGYKQEMILQLEQLKYLQAHDIKPMKEYEFNSINFTKNLIQILGMIFLSVGLAVFVSDMVSGELTPPTLKVLLTQPVSRGRVLLSKFISVSIVGVLLILLIEALYFIFIGLVFDFGNLNYPMTVGSKFAYDMSILSQDGNHPITLVAGSTYIIPVWQYIIRLFGLQTLFILVCTAFAFMMSSILKSSMVSMAATIVVLITSIVLFQAIGALQKYAVYSFTSYGDVATLVDGRIATILNKPEVNLGYALIVFAVWGIVCYGISHVVFTKKDILI